MAKFKLDDSDLEGLFSEEPEDKAGRQSLLKNLLIEEGKRRPLTQAMSTAQESIEIQSTNRQQSGNKLATKPEINRQQSDNKPTTTKNAISETGNKVAAEPATELGTKWQQTDNKVATKFDFYSLVGLQRALIIFIYECCKATGSRTTSSLTLEHIGSYLKTSSGSIKTTLQRLEDKGLIIRSSFKNGRSGWSKYELPENHYRELLQIESGNKLATKWQQTDSKVTAEPATEPATALPCSSSILNSDKNLTTTEPEFWLSVPKNLDGLVSVKQLREFVKHGLVSAEELQTSLDGFAFDLEKGVVKAKNGNPLAILIGAIKGGGYISQAYLSELKASLAEVEKTRTEMQRIRAEFVVEKIKEEFEQFRVGFPEEAEKLKPVGSFMNSFQPGGVGYRMWIEEYKRHKENDQNQTLGETNL